MTVLDCTFFNRAAEEVANNLIGAGVSTEHSAAPDAFVGVRRIQPVPGRHKTVL